MKISEVVDQLNLKVFSGYKGLHKEILGAYTSDLLSDVMGNLNEGYIWITLQTHQNIMAVSSLKDASAILMVKGLSPEASTIKMSEEEGIPILGTELETFEISGKLFMLLNQ
ncbi:DRTGG domain-containing protein [Saccharicrinis aurantiacus]|uniref:DRTGG domain-containing protein n=1 Tax=Saccharicrinis aurantiacus TaxID=1849719 RepID=UPI00094F7206|nr:DRTGG domain-containing protein [Saccharicrinis aurantiacus]